MIKTERFYLKESTIRSILRSTFNSRRDSIRPKDGLANTLLARDWRGPQCVQVGEVVGGKWDKMHDISKRVYEPNGIAPTVHCQQGGNTELKIAEDFVLGGLQKHQTPRMDGISPTLTEAMGKGGGQTPVIIDKPQERFYKQAFETLEENECEVGDTIDAFNKKVNKSGVCPTLTTRPEGFKTAILPVVGAMRGRNPEDPSDRTAGVPTEQRLEINEKGVCNALTTVQKDNLVIEENKSDYVSRRYNEFIEERLATPKKPADNTYAYVFKGWNKNIVAVSGDAEYIAQFDSVYVEYAILFKNYDGTVLSSKTYHYGDVVEEPESPVKPADNTYTYTFKAWDKEIVSVSRNDTYTATYEATYIEYTVVFKNYVLT